MSSFGKSTIWPLSRILFGIQVNKSHKTRVPWSDLQVIAETLRSRLHHSRLNPRVGRIENASLMRTSYPKLWATAIVRAPAVQNESTHRQNSSGEVNVTRSAWSPVLRSDRHLTAAPLRHDCTSSPSPASVLDSVSNDTHRLGMRH